MQEILFRGKAINTGEWVEGWFVGKICDSIFSPARKSSQIIDDNLMWNEVIPETVGKYTGLTDRNGKRIFEGGIVKNSDVIKFGFHKAFSDTDPYEYGEAYGFYLENEGESSNISEDFVNELEVIGNIYDNPELLGTRENES